jgi:hypothetical protein
MTPELQEDVDRYVLAPDMTRLSVKWRRGESAPSDTKPIRDAVVVATADCVTREER